MENKYLWNVKSDQRDENHLREAKELLKKRDEILDALAANGMHEDSEEPYAYYIPTNLSFECGKGPTFPIRSTYAIIEMARASYADAHFLDCDREGVPELPQFTAKGKEGFYRVFITDPFAMHIDNAIQRHQEKMVSEGKGRVVNGRFYKVA